MKKPNPDPAKHQEIPIWNAEDWLHEDIVIGHRIRSIRRTLSEGECMQFNALVLDMHPYVADEIFAKEEGSLEGDLWPERWSSASVSAWSPPTA